VRMSADQCFFRAQLFYQVMEPWHIADAGLEFDMNLSTGINTARFPNNLNLNAPGNEDRLQEAIMAATTIVPQESSRGDGALLQNKLESAVTWGNHEEVAYLLRSCWITEEDALVSLGEAAKEGFEECVTILLNAGVGGSTPIQSSGTNKNALHLACENGQEECAKLIISSLKNVEEVYKVALCGPEGEELTCFDLLRRSDLSGMARRLEALAKEKLEEKFSIANCT
jgi:hypothetical protein